MGDPDTPTVANRWRRAGEVLVVFLGLGLTSFGGPIAHLGYFRRTLVERRKWLTERAYADLVALCQFLPGPASGQVGMGVGLQRAGLPGLLAAWIGFTLPSATGASLLLNAEGVFTALIAWVVFRENVDRWVALGMLAIVAGAVVLVVPMGVELGSPWAGLAVLGACLGWAIDNNLTRKVSLTDATWLAAVKGLVAGPTNLVLALLLGSTLPAAANIAAAAGVGFLAYGVSLALFIVALRHLGTARAGAYFSVAPFFGAVLAVALGEPVTVPLLVAGALMGVGVWLHLRERHVHEHTHPALTHDHWHIHDDAHHDHPHGPDAPPVTGRGHRHPHEHAELSHAHPHYPDAHHRHDHSEYKLYSAIRLVTVG
ncbi:MAG: chromate transporter [Propionibacteriaceae bacterium]|nr:chromate transporter [Propionibacteriaceae bacterium]